MAMVNKTALVQYTAEQMFGLIDAVELYPEFLPWCGGATVSFRDTAVTCATIIINYRGIRQSFSTENRKTPPELMTMTLIDGPFRKLDGEWRLKPLGSDGCKIDFGLHYEFSSTLLEKLIGPVFGYIAGTMVDAFLQRADRLYGAT